MKRIPDENMDYHDELLWEYHPDLYEDREAIAYGNGEAFWHENGAFEGIDEKWASRGQEEVNNYIYML